MKANELRIGNFINYRIVDKLDERQEWDEASIIDGQDLDYLEKNPNDKDYQPIPLTEEWLLRFGFEKQMAWTFAIELTSNLKFVYYLGQKGWSINNKNYPDFTNLKHVNSLQNLYFALTGKELTIKPNE
jgi:hypothetical protein